MRRFFSEYGRVIIVSVIITVLIYLAVSVAGGSGSDSIQDMKDNFDEQSGLEVEKTTNVASADGEKEVKYEAGTTWQEWTDGDNNNINASVTTDEYTGESVINISGDDGTYRVVVNNDDGTSSQVTSDSKIKSYENYSIAKMIPITVTSTNELEGTIEGSGNYAEGSKVTLTAVPNAGFALKQWSSNSVMLSTANPYTFIAEEEKVIDAEFKEDKHYITYDLQGGEGNAEKQQLSVNSVSYITEVVPTKEHFTFAGWNTSALGLGQSYASGDLYKAAGVEGEDVTLYAQWSAEPTFTITYDANGGENPPASTIKYQSSNAILTEDEPTKDGYGLACWNTEADGSGTSYAPGGLYIVNEDVTLYAIYEVASTLSFDTDGGSEISSIPMVTSRATKIPTSIPLKTDFTFAGWKLSADNSFTVESIGDYGFESYTGTDTYMFGSETSFEEGWYRSTNTNVNSSVALAKITITNTTAIPLTIDVLDYTNESSYDYGTLSLIDSTLSSDYSVNYNNGASDIKWSGRSNHKKSGETIDYGTLEPGTHTIYIRYKKDGSGNNSNDRLYFRINSNTLIDSKSSANKTYQPGDIFKEANKNSINTTLKASYKSNYSTLKFNTNSNDSVETINTSKDEATVIPEITPINSGYTFEGWYESDKDNPFIVYVNDAGTYAFEPYTGTDTYYFGDETSYEEGWYKSNNTNSCTRAVSEVTVINTEAAELTIDIMDYHYSHGNNYYYMSISNFDQELSYDYNKDYLETTSDVVKWTNYGSSLFDSQHGQTISLGVIEPGIHKFQIAYTKRNNYTVSNDSAYFRINGAKIPDTVYHSGDTIKEANIVPEEITLNALWKIKTAKALQTADGTLHFVYDTIDWTTGTEYEGSPITTIYNVPINGGHPWTTLSSGNSEVTKIEIENSFAEFKPKDVSYYFYGFYNATTIEGLSNLDTSYAENFEYMFASFGKNTTSVDLDLTALDLSNATKCSCMFSDVGDKSTIVNIDISNWNTSKVTNMNNMFSGIGKTNATEINIKGLEDLDVENVIYMQYMFYSFGQSKLSTISLDFRGWDTSNVIYIDRMFQDMAQKATTWDVKGLEDFNVSKVTSMSSMFSQCCKKVTSVSLDLSKWNTESLTDMRYMFYYSFYSTDSIELNMTGWDTSKVTNMESTFEYFGYATTTKLEIKGHENWNVSKVTTFYHTFAFFGYTLKEFYLDLSNWDVSSATNIGDMLKYAGYSATTWSIGDLSKWNVSKVQTICETFYCAGYNAQSFNLGDLSNWDLSSASDAMNAFAQTAAPEWYIGSCKNWGMSKMARTYSMFEGAGCPDVEFDLSTWNTSSLSNAYHMFSNFSCKSLGDLSNWNTSNLTNANSMFAYIGRGCKSGELNLYLSNWDVTHLTNTEYMFSDCRATEIHIENWDIPSGLAPPFSMYNNSDENYLTTIYCNREWEGSTENNYYYRFYKCKNLVGGNGTKLSDPYDSTVTTYARPDAEGYPGFFTGSATGFYTTIETSDITKGKVIVDNQYRLSAGPMTVKAKANYYYKFKCWSENEDGSDPVSTDATYTFDVTGPITLYAFFEDDPTNVPQYSIESTSYSSYTFAENSSGYYESNNKGKHSTFAMAKVTFTINETQDVTLDLINSGESSCDYGLISSLDTTNSSWLSTSNSISSAIAWTGQGKSSTNVQNYTFSNVSAGTHYFYVRFRKDSSASSGNDSLQFKINLE